MSEEDFLGPVDPSSAEMTLSDFLPDDVTSADDLSDLLRESPPQTHPLPLQVADDGRQTSSGTCQEADVIDSVSGAIPSTVQELADRLEEHEQGPDRTAGRCA